MAKSPVAYELLPALKVSQNIRYIAKEQLTYAYESLHRTKNPDKGVYEARKTFKRLRALLRFVKENISPALYARENATYRDMAQLLAPLRDGAVVVETLDKFQEVITPRAYRAIREGLVAHHESNVQAFWDGQSVENVIEQLTTAQNRAKFWKIEEGAWHILRPNILKVYERGRKGMENAHAHADDPLILHEWRKSVKHFWYHLSILRPLAPERLDPIIEEWDALGDVLGKAHDVMVLNERVQAMTLEESDAEIVEQMLENQRNKLEQAALAKGKTMYAIPIKPFLKELKVAFEVFYLPQEDTTPTE